MDNFNERKYLDHKIFAQTVKLISLSFFSMIPRKMKLNLTYTVMAQGKNVISSIILIYLFIY